MKGIQRRLFFNFVLIFIVIVVILIVGVFFFARSYYYDAVSLKLSNQAKLTANFYRYYLGKDYQTLEFASDRILKDYKDAHKAELQILTEKGHIYYSSSGTKTAHEAEGFDTEAFVDDNISLYIGNDPLYDQRIMAVTTPLIINNTKSIGYMRFVTSLEAVDRQLRSIMYLTIIVSGIVLFILSISTTVFSQTIINPVKDITTATGKISKGDYDAKIDKRYNDEIGDLASAINGMTEALKHSESMRHDFLSSISHELRTPLTMIVGWGETVLSGQLNKNEVDRGIQVIVRESHRLSGMVDELLDFSRLESDAIKLKKQWFPIKDLESDLINIFEDRAFQEDKVFTLMRHIGDHMFFADQNRIKQVLINLIDNAFKYTDRLGFIEVDITVNKERMRIRVKDDGRGIHEDDLPMIKEKFYKGKEAQKGSGIGLAVADAIVRRHGGTMAIDSTFGKGTNIEIILPHSFE